MAGTNAHPFDDWPEGMKVAYAKWVKAHIEAARNRAEKQNELLKIVAKARREADALYGQL